MVTDHKSYAARDSKNISPKLPIHAQTEVQLLRADWRDFLTLNLVVGSNGRATIAVCARAKTAHAVIRSPYDIALPTATEPFLTWSLPE